MEKLLKDGRLRKLLEHGDKDLARACRDGGCRLCGGVLHRARYERQPRGPDWVGGWAWRHSFCCAREGCRKRHTPPSLRFLGRWVYVSAVVVLVVAMMHGVKPDRVERLRQELGIDERTLRRWRAWWRETFVDSAFWRAARGRFMPVLNEAAMPYALVEAFNAEGREELIKLLEFLSPITTDSSRRATAM